MQRSFVAASAAEEARQIAAEEARKEALRIAEVRAQEQTEIATRQRRRALTATRVAVVVLVLAVAAGVFAGVQTNTADTAQAQVETQVAALNAIVPGATLAVQLATLAVQLAPAATQGARWGEWVSSQDQLILDGLPNFAWTPRSQEFDGVTMMQVPAGCFDMGSSDGGSDEQPAHPQCFGVPFWIDQTEVTQAQFARFGGVKAADNWFDGDQRPVEQITWFEARDFCSLRGARLPTEAEWEYAARGPDRLVYPWGDDFNGENAVNDDNSNNQTADVGSRPTGASWVGVQDMIGNVWEWVSSLYQPYLYVADDSREDLINITYVRILRGGSFVNSSINLGVAFRNYGPPHNYSYYMGFRCAHS